MTKKIVRIESGEAYPVYSLIDADLKSEYKYEREGFAITEKEYTFIKEVLEQYEKVQERLEELSATDYQTEKQKVYCCSEMKDAHKRDVVDYSDSKESKIGIRGYTYAIYYCPFCKRELKEIIEAENEKD